MSEEKVTFLLVEDDEIDVMAMQRTFKRLAIPNRTVVARDGLEALAALRGEDGFERIQRPYIVLLDLNMPRMNGIEFLDEVRSDPTLRSAIVFVMTTSRHDLDRRAAYERNVAGYLVKSKAADGFLEAMDMINRYGTVVDLP